MKLCPNCGFENKDSGKFCIHCGTPLAAVEVTAVNTDPLDTDFIRPAAPEEPVPETPAGFEFVLSDYPEAEPETPNEEVFNRDVPAAPVVDVPAYDEPTPAAPARNAVPGYDRRQIRLKDVLRSGKARTIAVCLTVLLVLSIALSIVPAFLTSFIGNGAEDLIDIIPVEELGDMIAEAIEGLTGGEYTFVMPDADDIADGIATATGVSVISTVFSAIMSNLIPLLTVISMWMIYGTASKNNIPCCGTSGLTILKVIEILRLIGVCLVIAITATGLGVAAYLMSTYNEGVNSAFWVICGVVALAYLLVILFYAGTIRTLSIFTAVAEGRPYKGKVSLYASVIFTLKGIFGILGVIGCALFTIVPLFMDDVRFLSLAGLAALLPSLVSVIWYFDMGSILRQARKALAE